MPQGLNDVGLPAQRPDVITDHSIIKRIDHGTFNAGSASAGHP